MQNNNGWLVLHDRDVIDIIIRVDAIEKVIKHFMEKEKRSYLCQGTICTFCQEHIDRRVRYIAPIEFKFENLKWEFSEEVYRLIQRLPATKGTLKATVIRLGNGKETRYQVSLTSTLKPPRVLNKYIAGKYGHMVKK